MPELTSNAELNREIATSYLKLQKSTTSIKAAKIILELELEELDDLQETLAQQTNQPTPTTPAENIKQPNWLTRQIDKRIEAKCRKYLQAEIDRLIALKKQNCPEMNEKDIDLIKGKLHQIHDLLWESNKEAISYNKFHFVAYGIVATLGLVATIVLATTTGIGGFAFVPVSVAMFGVLDAWVGYDLFKRMPDAYKSSVKKRLADIEEFAKSSETFEQLLDKVVAEANKLVAIPDVEPTIAQAAVVEPKKSVPHKKHKTHRHHLAKQSMFANDGHKQVRDGAEPVEKVGKRLA